MPKLPDLSQLSQAQKQVPDRQTIAIARVLNRSVATISREISRNRGCGGYSCRYAQQQSSWLQAIPCLKPSLGFVASAGLAPREKIANSLGSGRAT
jgi:hypothetical protein